MKQLKVFTYIEEQMGLRRFNTTKMARTFVVPVEQEPIPTSLVHDELQVVDYRMRIGARINVRNDHPHAFREAKKKVAKMFARELFGDMLQELIELEEWAYSEGYDIEMRQRLERLIRLAAGEEIPDV